MNLPFLVAGCDYSLIVEEIYAAGAILSRDEEMMGTIAGQDIGKLIAIGLLILGTILVNAGSNLLIDLLKL